MNPTTISIANHDLADRAAMHLRPNGGVLILTDADRSDFLHRMTTNNINALRAGQSAVTVLTSPTARILFVFTVVCRQDDLLLLPSPGETATLSRHLRGQIFFMDKVKVRDATSEFRRLRLIGARASTLLADIDVNLGDSPDGAWQESDGVLAVKQLTYDVPGYEVIAPAGQFSVLVDKLTAENAALIDDESYAAHRIALGRPAPGHELTGDYNPLEAGLAWVCAENKGCYTGQEIIARQVTYDKVTKTLVGLRSAELLPSGAPATVDGREVGAVTSSAYSSALMTPLALAILKRPHNQPGSRVIVGDQAAEVVSLPFV